MQLNRGPVSGLAAAGAGTPHRLRPARGVVCSSCSDGRRRHLWRWSRVPLVLVALTGRREAQAGQLSRLRPGQVREDRRRRQPVALLLRPRPRQVHGPSTAGLRPVGTQVRGHRLNRAVSMLTGSGVASGD